MGKSMLLYFLLCSLLVLAAGFFLPWYGVVFAGLICGIIGKLQPGRSFVLGFFAAFLVYAIYAMILDRGNEGILSARISNLFMGLPPIGLILLSALIGALQFSIASLFAIYLAAILRKSRN